MAASAQAPVLASHAPAHWSCAESRPGLKPGYACHAPGKQNSSFSFVVARVLLSTCSQMTSNRGHSTLSGMLLQRGLNNSELHQHAKTSQAGSPIQESLTGHSTRTCSSLPSPGPICSPSRAAESYLLRLFLDEAAHQHLQEKKQTPSAAGQLTGSNCKSSCSPAKASMHGTAAGGMHSMKEVCQKIENKVLLEVPRAAEDGLMQLGKPAKSSSSSSYRQEAKLELSTLDPVDPRQPQSYQSLHPELAAGKASSAATAAPSLCLEILPGAKGLGPGWLSPPQSLADLLLSSLLSSRDASSRRRSSSSSSLKTKGEPQNPCLAANNSSSTIASGDMPGVIHEVTCSGQSASSAATAALSLSFDILPGAKDLGAGWVSPPQSLTGLLPSSLSSSRDASSCRRSSSSSSLKTKSETHNPCLAANNRSSKRVLDKPVESSTIASGDMPGNGISEVTSSGQARVLKPSWGLLPDSIELGPEWTCTCDLALSRNGVVLSPNDCSSRMTSRRLLQCTSPSSNAESKAIKPTAAAAAAVEIPPAISPSSSSSRLLQWTSANSDACSKADMKPTAAGRQDITRVSGSSKLLQWTSPCSIASCHALKPTAAAAAAVHSPQPISPSSSSKLVQWTSHNHNANGKATKPAAAAAAAEPAPQPIYSSSNTRSLQASTDAHPRLPDLQSNHPRIPTALPHQLLWASPLELSASPSPSASQDQQEPPAHATKLCTSTISSVSSTIISNATQLLNPFNKQSSTCSQGQQQLFKEQKLEVNCSSPVQQLKVVCSSPKQQQVTHQRGGRLLTPSSPGTKSVIVAGLQEQPPAQYPHQQQLQQPAPSLADAIDGFLHYLPPDRAIAANLASPIVFGSSRTTSLELLQVGAFDLAAGPLFCMPKTTCILFYLNAFVTVCGAGPMTHRAMAYHEM